VLNCHPVQISQSNSAQYLGAIRPNLIEIKCNIPTCFRKFSDTRVVIDCIEIPLMKSKNLTGSIITYYDGHTNTYKWHAKGYIQENTIFQYGVGWCDVRKTKPREVFFL